MGRYILLSNRFLYQVFNPVGAPEYVPLKLRSRFNSEKSLEGKIKAKHRGALKDVKGVLWPKQLWVADDTPSHPSGLGCVPECALQFKFVLCDIL